MTTAAAAAVRNPAPSPAGAARVLRVLHVGVANRGRWPLERCNPSTGFQPAALCDVSSDALTAGRSMVGLPESACFTDFDRALSEVDADCAILCVPTVLHLPMVRKVLAAGLHVLVEKGMAPDWPSAKQMAATVAAANRVACVAQNYRYQPVEQTIWRAVNDPDSSVYVGDVHMLTYTQNRVRPVPRTLNYPFASVWDMSCHHFDNMMHWFGPIARMSGAAWRAGWSAYEHPNNTSAHIEFQRSGIRAHYLHTHDASRASLDIEVHGDRGALVFRDGRMTFNDRPLEQFGVRPIVDVPLVESHGEDGVLRDFHAYVTLGCEPGISVQNNLETMAACEMFVRSVTQGRTIARNELD